MNDRKYGLGLLGLARDDLAALNAMIGSPEFTPAIRGFHAQQAVEKALKAWLACVGVCFPKTHDLRVLFDRLVEAGVTVPEPFRQLERLGAYAVMFRYDAFEGPPENVDFAATSREVEAIIKHIEKVTQRVP